MKRDLINHLKKFVLQKRLELFEEKIQQRTKHICLVLEDIYQGEIFPHPLDLQIVSVYKIFMLLKIQIILKKILKFLLGLKNGFRFIGTTH